MNENTTAHQVAMHEAGHILFAALTGAESVVIHGSSQSENGRGFYAQAEAIYSGPRPNTSIFIIACHLSAGGAAARILASGPIDDDLGDIENFTVCAINAGVPPEKITECWQTARQMMEGYFALPEVQPHMQGLAAKIEAQIEEANESSQRKVICPISDLIEIPFLLQLFNRNS